MTATASWASSLSWLQPEPYRNGTSNIGKKSPKVAYPRTLNGNRSVVVEITEAEIGKNTVCRSAFFAFISAMASV